MGPQITCRSMPNRSAFDRRLLGGLSANEFLARHWQRKPLLIRAALERMPVLPDRDALCSLAARDDVEARLITSFGGQWGLMHGPIAHMPRRRRDWTLLVQGVNLHDANADAVMRRFDFVSAMRLDDLMMSYAVDGGSVGAHVDSYDVFLLQVEGARRWRWNRGSQREHKLIAGAPLKLLSHFQPTDEAVLEPGDMLYLPPHCAHEGVAVGSCITASIGFRASSWNELTQEFLFAMAEREWPDGRGADRYTDRGRRASLFPAAIEPEQVDAIADRLTRIRWSRKDVEAFVGRAFSEPKAHVYFDAPRPLSLEQFKTRVRGRALVLDRKTTMLYRGGTGFICGEAFEMPVARRDAFVNLANDRTLAASRVAEALRDDASFSLLRAWWTHGWIHIDSTGGAR